MGPWSALARRGARRPLASKIPPGAEALSCFGELIENADESRVDDAGKYTLTSATFPPWQPAEA
eukprot:7578814-Pyramimonas_sp.AAC.1